MREGREEQRRRKGKVEKWASFTRPRLVPKAGRGMEGWAKRQQVRQTHKYMKEKQLTHTREETAHGHSKMCRLQQRKMRPWGLCCPTFINSLYGLFVLPPERRGLEIKLKVKGICVCEVKN